MASLFHSVQRIAGESFIARVDFHAELGSTNDRALELAEQGGLDLPLLVLTDQQTAGRGRGNNRWWSAGGALTFSVILHSDELNLPAERRPQASLTAGLGVCEALAEMLPGHNFGLKWPNDVYLGPRKVCGILVEVPSSQAQHLVIGVGINVNNSFRDAPTELRLTATSLVDETGERIETVEVLLRVLARLAEAFELMAHDPLRLNEAWTRRCILRGRTIHVQSGTRNITGRCHGIAPDGSLLIETPAGLERILSGVIGRFE